MSAWRRHQFVTSTQTARTRLAPTFVLVKRVLRVTVIPVKVNDHKNIDWTKTLVTSVTSIIAIIWNGLLSSQEQWYHLFVRCCFIFNNLTTIEASGTSFVAGCTLHKNRRTFCGVKRNSHQQLHFSLSLSQFQLIFVSFVAILLFSVAFSRPFRFSVEI